MRAIVFVPVVLAGVFGLASCEIDGFGPLGRFTQDFHYTYPLKADGRVSLETFNGAVELSGWDQDSVDVTGTKYTPTAESADTLRIEASNTPDSVSIRATRPSDLRGGWGARFFVKMPRRAVLNLIKTSNGEIRVTEGSGPARLRSSNGSIRVQGLQGSVDAQTSNASVELLDVQGDAVVRTSNGRVRADNLKGALQANTSNAGVTANLSAATGRAVRLETSNGGVDVTLPTKFDSDVRVGTSNSSITLHLPPDLNARVSAHTSNASVHSDFDVRMQGDLQKSRLEGVIGSGGPLIDLNTSNGGIRLLKM